MSFPRPSWPGGFGKSTPIFTPPVAEAAIAGLPPRAERITVAAIFDHEWRR